MAAAPADAKAAGDATPAVQAVQRTIMKHEQKPPASPQENGGKAYGAIIGRTVSGTVDRPLGSAHPDFPDLIYPVNYGYADGIPGGDGEEQDVYVLGVSRPVRRFAGRVIAVWHRLDDCEDKWIVSADGRTYTRDEILEAIRFQERFFTGELYQ